MKTSSVRLLILEDDTSLGEALKEGISREGHEVFWAQKPDEALSLFSTEKFDFMLVDCLLPQMTGVEFLEKARNQSKQPFKAIIMSGIYTDKAFIQESIQQSHAIAFLKKPFDLTELLKLLKKEEVRSADISVRKNLYQIFTKEKISVRDKRHLIESIDEISGYDLPFVYSLLSETKSSGYLNIYYPDGVVSGVTFASGAIIAVDIEDKNTFLGEMLIQSGYITNDDLQLALADKSKKRLGARLVQGNFMSPHALDLVMTEQMNVRLSRTITSQHLKINFAASDVELIQPSIDSDQIVSYLHDWITSKIPVDWLKSLYTVWLGNRIVLSPTFKADHEVFNMSIIQTLDGIVERLQKGSTLSQLLTVDGYQEMAVFKGIHFLLIKGLISLSSKVDFKNENEQFLHLKSLKQQFNRKNPTEILGLIGATSEVDRDKQVQDFINSLGAKPANIASPVGQLWTELKKLIEDSVTKSSDQGYKNSTQNVAPRNDAESKLKANQLIEQVKKDLYHNQFSKALANIEMAQSLSENIYQLYLYSAWIKLGLLNEQNKIKQMKDVELDLMQVPPDERYDALYPFVMGLFLKAKGDFNASRKSLEKALALDSTFLVARRELGHLTTLIKPKQDIFNMDLKQVVSGFFKKKA